MAQRPWVIRFSEWHHVEADIGVDRHNELLFKGNNKVLRSYVSTLNRRPLAAEAGPAGRAAARVLVIEDERLVAADLQQALGELGYDAYATASSGDVALALARETVPDIALADVRIDGPLDGIDTAIQLQHDYGTSVIFLTAHADDATVDRAKNADPDGYLIKPVSPTALKAAIELSLSKRQRHRRLHRWLVAMTQRRSRLATALHQVRRAVQLEDEHDRVVYVNQTFCTMFSISEAAADLSGMDSDQLLERIKSMCAAPQEFADEAKSRRRTQEPILGELVALADGRVVARDHFPLFDGSSRTGQLWVYEDVSERKRERFLAAESTVRRRLTLMADELTGLHDRRGFFLLAESHLERSDPPTLRKVLFFVDLNRLKDINDHLGHLVGDQAIREMARLLKETFRESDLLARLGGDEFVALAAVPPGGVESIKARLLQRLHEFNNGCHPYRLEASVGAAEYVRGDSLDALINRADQDMYRHKRGTRYSPLSPHV